MKMMKLNEIQTSDEMLELRPLDAFTVSRYRQHVRTGVEFPPLILDADGLFVVSGNHRFAAYAAELVEDAEVAVELRKFATNRERLECMARENMSHGMPMDGITRRRVALALSIEGMSLAEIAQLFNVPERTIEKWGEHTVVVIGKGNGRNGTIKPVKAGPDLATGQKITQDQYTTHIKQDMGASFRQMAKQIIRWLDAGWVNLDDERNDAALEELRRAVGN
jgi:hypothetical protein